ncbi:hypothetical protein DID88_008650 [Monilinia fructigena]|uniref:Uncharacterized protein n=1 Tax=Monilinia fructigena TaxID=38457 RepID=A0A395J5Z1_9HELO|nr:hypothetical protein DID88_008650 [Monilinia fructigena]
MSTPAAKRRRIEAANTLQKPFRSPFNFHFLASQNLDFLSCSALNADPDIAPLLKEQRELERQLKEFKEELDMAEQAKKIERDSKAKDKDGSGEIDGELLELCEKWKGASRLAAEELFEKLRDRVNRMGGPRVWKEMHKRQQEYQNNWQYDESNNNNNNNDSDDENEEESPGLGDTGENPGEEDELTMAMMLDF